jgi:hypothetical protein
MFRFVNPSHPIKVFSLARVIIDAQIVTWLGVSLSKAMLKSKSGSEGGLLLEILRRRKRVFGAAPSSRLFILALIDTCFTGASSGVISSHH